MEGEHSEWREGGKRGALCMGREEGVCLQRRARIHERKKVPHRKLFVRAK